MGPKDQAALEDGRYTLLFGVRRSIRYHSRRRQFFERLELFSNFISLVFGSATIAAVLAQLPPSYAVSAGALVSVVAAFNLVVGVSRMARLHEELARRFNDLEKTMVLERATTEEVLTAFQARRLEIEADEPPVMRILADLRCNVSQRTRARGGAWARRVCQTALVSAAPCQLYQPR